MPIKPQTEQQLLLAMERLLTNRAIQTDGRLNLSNLAKEAGVSRATVHRAAAICVEFHNRSLVVQEGPERARGYLERLRDLEQKLEQTIRSKNETIQSLQQTKVLLAQQVQALTVENALLRSAGQHTWGNITTLP